jgi:hypothetical protein
MKARARHWKGNSLAEFGPTVMLALGVVVFPMWAFGTIGMRFSLLLDAARLAAQSASRAQSFLSDVDASASPPVLSAVHIAQNVSSAVCAEIGGTVNNTKGIVLNCTSVYIKVCPIGGQTSSYSPQPAANTALAAAAQPSSYTYSCEVILNGTVQPLFPDSRTLFGINIPGFNGPITTNVRSDYLFENTNNLNL